MCGVFGVYAPDRDVARLTYFGLFALQHRGQESAGIAVSEEGRLTALRDLGLVTQVFDEQKLHGLRGSGRDRPHALLDDRLVGVGERAAARAARRRAHVALGHNGNLVNATALRDELRAAGVTLRATSDSEVIAALIANDEAPLEDAVANAMQRLDGAYSIVALSEGKLVAFRDPHGFRPLVLGRIHDDWVVASETCALDLVGAEFVREIEPRRSGARRRGRAARRCRRSSRRRRRRALHLRVLLSRAARHAARRRRGARRARAHGRAARARRRRSRPIS